MAKFFIIFLVAFFIGCAGSEIDYDPHELPANLCMEYDVSKSLIRKTAAETGIPLNQLYYGLIDAAAIALLTDALDREAVRDYLMDIRLFIEARPTLSYTYLIGFMTDVNQWGDQWPLIEGVLMRRIAVFNSSLIISEHDRCLILQGLAGAERGLYL